MIQLRPYQSEGLDAIWSYFANGGKGHPAIAWPTGTGKSIVPAIFIRDVMKKWPNQRFLMITHVKELIQQNYDVLKLVWPDAPVSIYSAGLKLKNPAMPVVFGGVQSMIKNPAIFGSRDIIFIDEAHLINQDDTSMYQTFLATMKLLNSRVKVIGMTATPFRMGQGLITDNGLFTDIVHDITGIEQFNRLIAEGYLSPLIPLRTKQELDVSGVQINKGEFVANQLQSAVDKKDINFNICKEIVEAGHDRKSWLVFASGIEHSEHIAELLSTFGIECAAVHSKQKSDYNDSAIKAFKEGRLRAIANYGKLTTGFNNPEIDLIPMIRPTLSVPLWVQMLGRGTRPALGKKNCLVLDFARNTPRLGPINDPIIPKKKGEGTGDIPVKLCGSCGAYNHTRVQFCEACGAEFQFKNKLVAKAGREELLASDIPVVEEFDTTYILYSEHKKEGKPPSLKATYYSGMQAFKEYICLEHSGYAKKRAHDWWRARHKSDPPATVNEALRKTTELRIPKKFKVWINKKHPEIISCEW